MCNRNAVSNALVLSLKSQEDARSQPGSGSEPTDFLSTIGLRKLSSLWENSFLSPSDQIGFLDMN